MHQVPPPFVGGGTGEKDPRTRFKNPSISLSSPRVCLVRTGPPSTAYGTGRPSGEPAGCPLSGKGAIGLNFLQGIGVSPHTLSSAEPNFSELSGALCPRKEAFECQISSPPSHSIWAPGMLQEYLARGRDEVRAPSPGSPQYLAPLQSGLQSPACGKKSKQV